MANISKICMKRLAGDVRMLSKDPMEFIEACPDDKDFLTWYFLVRGPDFSDFKGGYYIGKIIHDPEYPFKPPDFMMLTPNGRFMDGHKICLSNSSYHSNEWSALWNIKSILTGFLSIMLDDGEHGISHIHSSKEERIYMAKTSIEYNKTHFPDIIKKFSRFLDPDGNPIPITNFEEKNTKKKSSKEKRSKPDEQKDSKKKEKLSGKKVKSTLKDTDLLTEESDKDININGLNDIPTDINLLTDGIKDYQQTDTKFKELMKSVNF